MSQPRSIVTAVAVAMLAAAAAPAQQAAEPNLTTDYPLLPEAREIELARSAGLPTWTGEATIYVLERGGYRVAQQGTNGFSCLVGRDFPGTLWPVCYDPEGTETIVPRLLRHAELREQGKSEEEIRREDADRFFTGVYRAPRKPGLAYMLSKENLVGDGERVFWFPPHLMFYAPYMRDEDIGASFKLMPHSPAVLYDGDPHAYFIAVVPDAMPAPPAEQEPD